MAKVSFLFWNLNRKPLGKLVSTLAREHEVDVLILAECTISIVGLLEDLNDDALREYNLFPSQSQHFVILGRFPLGSLRPVRDTGRLAVRRLVPPIGVDILLAIAHLPSKLFERDSDQTQTCVQFVRYVEEAGKKYGHTRTVVCGDFNMNPFEDGLVGAMGFHATMSRRIASGGQRRVHGEMRQFFYNPMWSFLGDASPGPPGTYYRGPSGPVSLFWHMFDQLLVRPDLLSRFDIQDLALLTSAGNRSLLTASDTPDGVNGSDHFPILFRINLDEGGD